MALEKTPLLAVPTEIRLMIYGFLFASIPIRPFQNISCGGTSNQQATNILLVSHQIRSEALGILFDEGKFVVELSNQ